MKARFEGRVALVTGAARGQGRSHALAFAREGADIVVNDICKDVRTIPYHMASEEQMNSVVEEIKALGRRAIGVKADVSKSGDVKAMIDKTMSEFGKIDILVNNHGIADVAYCHEMTEEQWDEMINVDLKGVFLTTRYILPHMIERRYGRIISTSSCASSVTGLIGLSHYSAAKAGIIGFTKTVALEVARYNITVNAVCPGLLDTDQNRGIANAHPDYYLQEALPQTGMMSIFPAGHMDPEDITNAVTWLASEESRYVTGTALIVDAGYSCK